MFFRDAGNLWRALIFSYDPSIMDLRALVVCSDQKSTSLLTTVLSEKGMVVEATPSISHGLKLLGEERYDAIIFDYRADQTSEEFLARLRQCPKNRATVLIAIVDAEFNTRPIFGLGANFVLYRPLSLERLRLSLQAARGLMRREHRRSPRSPVRSAVNVSYPGAPDLGGMLNDLSDDGTSITTGGRLPKAGRVYFEFALPGQQQLVRLSGEVAWQDASGRSGIRFLDVPQASRRLIRSWLQQKDVQQQMKGIQKLPAATAPSSQRGEMKGPARAGTAGNRRGEARIPCAIGAEVYRLGTSIPNRCRLSDISEGGCYVEMPSPLAGRSRVEIVVRTADMKFKIQGQVLATHPGFGMGVRFVFSDPAERGEILRLLGVLAAGPSLDEQPR
jgi:CheY-like chemotaxis protein/c-di-GMP-binding flagellar brake protein YcgR